MTSGGVDKLAVYQGLAVPEVLIWENKQLTLYNLRQNQPQITEQSEFFPQLNWQFLANYIRPQSQPQAVKEFIQALRSQN